MAQHPSPIVPYTTVPLIPVEVLRRFQVHERDTRYRAAARLLQALWLQERQIPIGLHRGRDGRPRKLGSRLSTAAALAGRNFLTPALATIAHRMIAYQEPGALIGDRPLSNALSSSAVCVNTIGTLIVFRALGARVLQSLFPDLDIDEIIDVRFEHSPFRGPGQLDKTAFDAVIWFSRSAGRGDRGDRGDRGPCRRPAVGCLAFEFKYSEDMSEAASLPSGRYDDIAEASGLFKDPYHAVLRVAPLQQLFREHLLAQGAAMADHAEWPDATFVLVGPAANERVQRHADLYRSFLNPTLPGQVPFVHITLDAFVNAIEKAGGGEQAAMLYERYLAFDRIDELVSEAVSARVRKWHAAGTSAVKPKPVKLISKAA